MANLPKRKTEMALKIKADYVSGTLDPLQPLELDEGTVVTLAIEDAQEGEKKTHSAIRMVEQLRESMGEIEWDGVPMDGSLNYRRYLYGHPKVGDR